MITKQVEGIAASQIPDESFTFQVKRGEEVIEEVKLPQNGQWSASLQAIEPGEYTVTEIAQEQNNYRLGHTFYLVGQESQTEGMTAQIDVAKEQTVTVTYTNQYQPLMVVPTGVENRMFPTILIETAGVTGGAFFCFFEERGKKKIHEIKRRDSSFSDSSCISSGVSVGFVRAVVWHYNHEKQ